MNPDQVAEQLEFLLQTLLWNDVGDPVFGHAVISAMDVREAIAISPRRPLALVRYGAVQNDPDFPEIINEMDFGLELVVGVPQDPYGRAGHVGGSRPSLTSSGGRGVGEVAREVLRVVDRNDAETGITILSRAVGADETVDFDGQKYVKRKIRVTAKGGTEAFYHAPWKLAKSGNNLTWRNPPTRFDFHAAVTTPSIPARGRMILRFAAGSTAPSSPSAGTGASLSGSFATSFTHTAGAGTFSYALFGSFDLRGAGADDAHSEAATLTGVFT